LTPVRNNAAVMQDSPYSDYFTDENRSVDDTKAVYSMPSPDTQRLLLRLNNLGAQILRQDQSGLVFGALSERLDALEDTLNSPERHAISSHMTDSGLYMEDDDTPGPVNAPSAVSTLSLSLDGAIDGAMEKATYVQSIRKQRDQSRLLKDAQMVLQKVTRANTDLRTRFDEMRDLNDQYASQVEESAREALTMKSENEALKQDLAFDHSELLFLKLQLKALELQADGMMEGRDEDEEEQHQIPSIDYDIQRWKSDCEDVDARLRGRRQTHRVISSTPTKFLAEREDGKQRDDQGDWKLDMCKKHQGRVQSITIRRLSMGLDGAEDADQELEVADEEVFDSPSGGASSAQHMSYCEQGTQTEAKVMTDDAAMFDEAEGDVAVYSAESRDDSNAEQTPARTPWQFLWSELEAFAGMSMGDR